MTLTDTIRTALDRLDAEMLSVLTHAEAVMECALEALQSGKVDEAIDHLRIGLEQVSRTLDEYA